MLFGGERVDSATGETIPVRSPTNQGIFAHMPRAGAENVDPAVKAATAALKYADVPESVTGMT